MKSAWIALGVLAVVGLGFGVYMKISKLINASAPGQAAKMEAVPPVFPVAQTAPPSASPTSAAPAPKADAPPKTMTSSLPISEKTAEVLRQYSELISTRQLDDALALLNTAIQANPDDPVLYNSRAYVYAQEQKYDLERQDFNKAVELGDKTSAVKFNLAEIDFVQKNYDAARPGFLALENDIEQGDLASYKVFLCDLLGNHPEEAKRELDAFNLAGINASYYFANIASNLYNHKPDAARPFLDSANRIFSHGKVELYSTSLTSLGYLPISAPAAATN